MDAGEGPDPTVRIQMQLQVFDVRIWHKGPFSHVEYDITSCRKSLNMLVYNDYRHDAAHCLF